MTRTRTQRRPVKGQAATHRAKQCILVVRGNVEPRIAIRGLTYELLCASLDSTNKAHIIATYRIIGVNHAKSK